MDREHAIELLPPSYAEALCLRDAGRAQDIPDRLNIPPEAVHTLLRLAENKLVRLMEAAEHSPPDSTEK